MFIYICDLYLYTCDLCCIYMWSMFICMWSMFIYIYVICVYIYVICVYIYVIYVYIYIYDLCFLSENDSSCSYVALKPFYRVLAFSTNYFHLLLYWTRVFQFGNFNFCISFLTSSTQRVFGLPIGLLETVFQECIAFTILVPCILSMWRASSVFVLGWSLLCSYVLLFHPAPD